MKIYTLPIDQAFQPAAQPFRYPKHNDDYGVEQDFLAFIRKHPEISTNNPGEASFHYLPVFWTRWHLNNNYAKTGLDVLQQEIDRVMINDAKTFTICQYDDGPLCRLGRTIQFLASRTTDRGIDIPLLSSPHSLPFIMPKKRFKASFAGRLANHPIRTEMGKCLERRDDVCIEDIDKGPKYFVRKLLASYVALSPRGYGGNSFRFYEAMQLGVVPFMISDIDTRPFKKFIDWSGISLFAPRAGDVEEMLDRISPDRALHMGKECAAVWREMLCYQKWCTFVLQELETLP